MMSPAGILFTVTGHLPHHQTHLDENGICMMDKCKAYLLTMQQQVFINILWSYDLDWNHAVIFTFVCTGWRCRDIYAWMQVIYSFMGIPRELVMKENIHDILLITHIKECVIN